MEMLSELWSNIKFRVRNPFYGTLALMFLLWNWQAVLVLFYPMAHLDLFDRLNWLRDNVYITAWFHVTRIYVYPILSALAALTVFPWMLNRLDTVYYGLLVQRRNFRVNADKALLLTSYDKAELIKHIRSLEQDLDESKLKYHQLDSDRGKLSGELMILRSHGNTTGMPANTFYQHYVEPNHSIIEVLQRVRDDRMMVYVLMKNGEEFNQEVRMKYNPPNAQGTDSGSEESASVVDGIARFTTGVVPNTGPGPLGEWTIGFLPLTSGSPPNPFDEDLVEDILILFNYSGDGAKFSF